MFDLDLNPLFQALTSKLKCILERSVKGMKEKTKIEKMVFVCFLKINFITKYLNSNPLFRALTSKIKYKLEISVKGMKQMEKKNLIFVCNSKTIFFNKFLP